MSQPPRSYLRDVFHTINLASRVPYLLYDLWLYSVEHAGKDGLARLPHDHEDGRSNDQPHDGVREWVAQPHPHGPGQDGEARPAVGPGVVAVRHKRRAPYLPADADAEHGHRLVAQEPEHGRHGDGPQHPMGCGWKSLSIAWYPATTALKRMMRTTSTPARSSTLP